MARQYAEIIREARAAQGLNQQQLADQLDVSRNTVAGWETAHSRPDLDLVPRLCKVLRISLSRFFGVKGGLSEQDRHLLDRVHALPEGDREIIGWQVDALFEKREAQRLAAEAAAPVRILSLYASDLGAAAGFGGVLGEAQGERVFLLEDENTSRADEVITVSGHSMEPTFADGDRVLVKHVKELREGEIGIFMADGEGYIKEYRKDGLHSHNPAYGPMLFSEYSDVRCIGQVIGLLRQDEIPTEEQIRRFTAGERSASR